MRVSPTVPIFLSLVGLSVFACADPELTQGAERRQTRTFQIRSLTEEIPDFPLRDNLAVVAYESEENFMLFEDDFPFLWYEEQPEAPFESYSPWTCLSPQALIDLIRWNISPSSWTDPRNRIEANKERLTCTQSPEVLEAIEDFLT